MGSAGGGSAGRGFGAAVDAAGVVADGCTVTVCSGMESGTGGSIAGSCHDVDDAGGGTRGGSGYASSMLIRDARRRPVSAITASAVTAPRLLINTVEF
jgi:hypothetical protein